MKDQLQVVRRLNQGVHSLVDVLVPKNYCTQSSEALVVRARREYFQRDESGDSYECLISTYLTYHARGPKTSESVVVESNKSDLALTSIRHSDSLSKYRQRHGLDKLKVVLFEKLAHAASFQGGLSLLCNHIDSRNNVKQKGGFSPQSIEGLDCDFDAQVLKVCKAYPDLNADEVSWLALVSGLNGAWIFDFDQKLFFPSSLVGMDPEGIVFSTGEVDECDTSRVYARCAAEVGGITGLDQGVCHYPFRVEVSTAIRALILLDVSESDLFEKLIEDESLSTLKHGDAMLIKDYLERHLNEFGLSESDLTRPLKELIRANDNQLNARTICGIRTEIVKYFKQVRLANRNGDLYCPADVVKILGTLEYLPDLVRQRQPFEGFLIFYGNTIQFLDQSGEIQEAVPLVEHLRTQVGYYFHDKITSSQRKAQSTQAIFTEISDRIREKNIDEGNCLALDRLQDQILTSHGILVPIHAATMVSRPKNWAEVSIMGTSDGEELGLSLKFGYCELQRIANLLDGFPSAFAKRVRSLSKSRSEYLSVRTFKEGALVEGSYDPNRQNLSLYIPKESPFVDMHSYAFLPIYELIGLNKLGLDPNTRLSLKVFQHSYYHTFVHELMEAVDAETNGALSNAWSKIGPGTGTLSRQELSNTFLTRYGTTSSKEDLCESGAVYALCGEAFRAKAASSSTFRKKYDFLSTLFSIDGGFREFPDEFPDTLHIIAGDPSIPWTDLDRSSFLETLNARNDLLETEIREMYSKQVLSYDAVEAVLDEFESRDQPITVEQATKIAIGRAEEFEQDSDESFRVLRVVRLVRARVRSQMVAFGITVTDAEALFDELCDCIFEKNEVSACAQLCRSGVSLEVAQAIIGKVGLT